jgi:peptidoglycan hydrolase-like protein with peptidoglycan-binding domain
MPPATTSAARMSGAARSPYTPAPSVRLPAEAVYAGDITSGTSGARARWVQEWLTLSGVGVMVDGEFGPATAAAVRAFQRRAKLPSTGVVDRADVRAARRAHGGGARGAQLPPGAAVGDGGGGGGAAAPRAARRARWAGGTAAVGAALHGRQPGAAWPWCAGFARSCWRRRAPRSAGRCPWAARSAATCSRAGARPPAASSRGGRPTREGRPAGLALPRAARPGDWEHIGIVAAARPDAFHTIEGNTNDAGDRDGYEACARVRGYDRKDFVRIA